MPFAGQEIHLWDLKRQALVHKYAGHKQERFAIRSCLGGSREAFVASGSEDGHVYLFHRESEKVLDVIKGHTASVNSVAWHPLNPSLLASASDDHSVRIWGPSHHQSQHEGMFGEERRILCRLFFCKV